MSRTPCNAVAEAFDSNPNPNPNPYIHAGHIEHAASKFAFKHPRLPFKIIVSDFPVGNSVDASEGNDIKII